jgi:hypothetical protein
MGKNVKESFAEAVIQTEIFTDKGDQGSVNAPLIKASSVNNPPDSFKLLYPGNGTEITSLGVLASLSADPTAEA